MHQAKFIADEIINEACEIAYLNSALQDFEMSMKRNPETDFFLDDAKTMIAPRLTKRLISLAGLLRNYVFEQHRIGMPEDDWEQASQRCVGLQVVAGKESDLMLKDACNRLLHCTWMGYPFEDVFGVKESLAQATLSDSVLLTGMLCDKKWSATINIPTFATAAYVAAGMVSEHR